MSIINDKVVINIFNHIFLFKIHDFFFNKKVTCSAGLLGPFGLHLIRLLCPAGTQSPTLNRFFLLVLEDFYVHIQDQRVFLVRNHIFFVNFFFKKRGLGRERVKLNLLNFYCFVQQHCTVRADIDSYQSHIRALEFSP